MRSPLCASLIVAANAVGLLLVAPAPPASAAPPECAAVGELPDVRPDIGGSQDGVIAEAVRLLGEGELDAAERLYEAALTVDAPDPRAGKGLAYIRAARPRAEEIADSAVAMRAAGAEGADDCFVRALGVDAANETALEGREADQPEGDTPAESAADRWDAFFAGWVDPAGRALLPLLAVLAVLLVAARLVTPLMAPTEAEAWPNRPRRAAWWAGLVLIVLVAVHWTALLSWSPVLGGAAGLLRFPLLAAVVALVLAVTLGSRRGLRAEIPGMSSARERSRTPSGQVATAVALAVLVVACVLLPDDAWVVLSTSAVALLGVVLHAAGRGHALRLQVQVKQGNEADPGGTAYVLAALQQLGTSPPRGLKSPQQVDVKDLPTDALSSLPTGTVTAALTSMLGLLLPSVPWRASVEDADGGRVVVTVTRNGAVAETVVVDGTQFRARRASPAAHSDEEAEKENPVDRSALLTAAAAVILTELSKRHRQLAVGLCGARRWDSVAAHVVATRPGSSADRSVRRELLAFAVQRDPDNALARTAYFLLLGEDATEGDAAIQDARRLARLAGLVERQQAAEEPDVREGYVALRLRIAHAEAAAWLNVCVDQRLADPVVTPDHLGKAESAIATLRTLLEAAPPEPTLEGFVAELWLVHATLEEGLRAVGSSAQALEVDTEPADDPPHSLHVLYDQACTFAVRGRRAVEPGKTALLESALDRLELAAGLDQLRESARTDPAFAWLRQDGGGNADRWKRWWAIIEEPAAAFTDLAPFGRQGGALRELALDEPARLYSAVDDDAAAAELARRLRVPRSVVGRWRQLAELAAPPVLPPTGAWLGIRELRVLEAAGISSTTDLTRVGAGMTAVALRSLLDEKARVLHIRPLDGDEFEGVHLRALAWAAAAGSGAVSGDAAAGRGGGCVRR